MRQVFERAILLGGALLIAQAAQAQDADIRGEGLSQTVDCQGGGATVQGNGNRLVFRGDCTALDLRGNGNSIRIELAPLATIHLEGNGNHVTYTLRAGAEPRVTIRGEGDAVSAGN